MSAASYADNMWVVIALVAISVPVGLLLVSWTIDRFLD